MNTMKLYNSLSHEKEDFKTHEPGKVSMYTCGPTVYHFAHIGNLRSYIMEDVLEKALRWEGYDVLRVMNITDVGHLSSDADTGEDKMVKGAKREHKTVLEIAQYYTDAFFDDCAKLNIKTPDVVQPATGMIPEYIQVITKLIDTGPGATSILTPPSWGSTMSLTTTTWRPWKWASGRAWRRTRTSATKTTLSCGSQSPSSRTRH